MAGTANACRVDREDGVKEEGEGGSRGAEL